MARSRHSVSKTEQRLEQKSETARETFSLLCYYSAVYHTFCFTNGMPETGYSVTNHNHYNFFKCDWCINCFIFTYHSVQLLMDSVIKQLAVITHL